MKTRAAVCHEVGAPWTTEEIEVDEPHAHEVQVEVAYAGMCQSDEHLRLGDISAPPELLQMMGLSSAYPVIGGHEGSGVVTAVGPEVQHVAVGDRVAVSFIPACSHAAAAVEGRARGPADPIGREAVKAADRDALRPAHGHRTPVQPRTPGARSRRGEPPMAARLPHRRARPDAGAGATAAAADPPAGRRLSHEVGHSVDCGVMTGFLRRPSRVREPHGAQPSDAKAIRGIENRNAVIHE